MEHLHTQMINTPVVRIGWPDQFIEHGAVPILRKKHGLTADALVEKVLPLLRKKSSLRPVRSLTKKRRAPSFPKAPFIFDGDKPNSVGADCSTG